MSHRREQIVSTLKRRIAEVIERQLSDPRIRGLVSITRVEISPDRSQAWVYVSIIPEQYESRTVAGLNAAAGHIQSRVSKLVTGRCLPALSFRLDESLKKEARVFQAIRQGMEKEKPQCSEDGPPDGDDGAEATELTP